MLRANVTPLWPLSTMSKRAKELTGLFFLHHAFNTSFGTTFEYVKSDKLWQPSTREVPVGVMNHARYSTPEDIKSLSEQVGSLLQKVMRTCKLSVVLFLPAWRGGINCDNYTSPVAKWEEGCLCRVWTNTIGSNFNYVQFIVLADLAPDATF